VKIFRFLGWFLLAAVCAAPIALSLASLPAMAADGTTVDFSPTAALLGQYLVVAIEGLVGFAIAWALRWLHLDGNTKAQQLADQARAALHGAVENGISRALAAVGGSISSVDVHNQVLASVLGYAQTNAASAFDRLGASPGELSKLIEARLGERGQPLTFVPARQAQPLAAAPA
jgi:hypothetical protein